MEPRNYLAFDLETVKPFPEGGDWREHRPLGIGVRRSHRAGLGKPSPLVHCGPRGKRLGADVTG